MHKKLESELVSLAHSILQMKNKGDVVALKNKAKEVYEKLAVLDFVDRYIEASHLDASAKEEILEKIENIDPILVEEEIADLTTEVVFEEKVEEEIRAEQILVEEKIIDLTTDVPPVQTEETKEVEEPIIVEEKIIDLTAEAPVAVIEEIKEELVVEGKDSEPEVQNLFTSEEMFVKKETKPAKLTLEEELKDTIPLDVATDIFENAVRVPSPKKSLNDKLVGSNLQIGLNDRIAFVKHLFEGNQGDFNRVVSQLNSFKAEKDAKKFINKMVKPDYDWSDKQEYEERFINLLERKFA